MSTATAELLPRAIADSSHELTVEVELSVDGVTTLGRAPAGSTRGGDEARVVGVGEALDNVSHVLLPALRTAAVDLEDHDALCALERRLADLAGPRCATLGANALLPVSIALWRAAAALHGLELWEYIRRFEPELAGTGPVRLFVGVLNGPQHALRRGAAEALGRQRFAWMEMQVVPRQSRYCDALSVAERVDTALQQLSGAQASRSARRGAFAPRARSGLERVERDVELVVQAIRVAGYEPGRDVQIALDPAGSHLYDAQSGTYGVGGRRLTREELARDLLALLDRHPGVFVSVEDPVEENDWEGLARLAPELRRRGVVVVGDDLFVTQGPRLLRGITDGSAGGLLVKPDQNGSLHGTLEVMKLARRHDVKLVLSHRSGETLDDTIADVAVAVSAWGLKAGDPWSEFRRRKYLRMIEIEATSSCASPVS